MVGLEKIYYVFSKYILQKAFFFINFNSQLARGLSSTLGGEGGWVCLLLKTNKNT